MPPETVPALNRRSVLKPGAAAALALPLRLEAVPDASGITLRAVPGRVPLVGAPHPETPVWAYNGTVPGPEIRVRQGERLSVRVENALDEETTVHWHGVRLPNAMDGVAHLTQRPIGSGETFLYEFNAVDAGTFWYHPHQRSHDQVGRGLYGALVVEEPESIRVDRDVVWVLDDWRLTQSAPISEDFGNGHDLSHQGRIGNTVTINGRVPDSFAVRAGERVRLRLINAANARILGLDFAEHQPLIVALDGQPVTPHVPESGLVVLGPAMRADVVLDMTGRPGNRASLVDRFYEGLEYRLVDLAYDTEPLRACAPDWPLELPPNPLAEPDLRSATRHEITFNGGMMGQRMMGADMGAMMRQMHGGKIWFITGQAATRDDFMGFTPHPAEADTLYASGHPAGGGNLGFIVSTDGGRTWEKLSPGAGGPVDFHQLDVSKADPAVIYGAYQGLQVSRDGGNSWELVGPAPDGLIDLAASAEDATRLYAATRDGLMVSPDAGASWQRVALPRRPVSLVEVTGDGTVYAFVLGSGLLGGEEGGSDRRTLSSDFGDRYLLHLAVDPTDSARLFAVTQESELLASHDSGRTWRQLGAP